METQFRNILWEKRKEGVLVAAHRGTNGANIIQNTCLSCENALLHSADLVYRKSTRLNSSHMA